MNSSSFSDLLTISMEELQLKNEAAYKIWGLGTFDRWDIDQEVGDLVFSNSDGVKVAAPAQIIGSFSINDSSWLWAWDNPSIVDDLNDSSWLWAWDNPSIVDDLKIHSLKLKAYGEKYGIEKLTTRKWIGTEDEAWAMTALAVNLCDTQGAYRGPAGSAYVFMTFGKVEISALVHE
ncbi:hypothetical protein D0962_15960 [Leptolyngbyaceae cyanobacterium CCMR0082]|uniref:Uncharacterized protein n=1 Tax=Adonisia turfae CCMR0082 TaxID=2304604 RepID=A0A6M0S719_9CYAN|nr:DUF6882 domain-containing protein [Adonisia turfae]NEZ64267.1 hypothetical protein [Adonisia turfae CCMR0082]